MNFPKDNICLEHILQNFKKLIDDYQFTIKSISSKEFNIRVTYINEIIEKRIEIVNQTKYSDYGFSIFVYAINNNTYEMPINVPFLQQDKECKFIEKASIDFFHNIDNFIGIFNKKRITD